MNPCIGDRQLEPDDEPDCEWCEGCGFVYDDNDNEVECGSCDNYWVNDPGEPNEDPE